MKRILFGFIVTFSANSLIAQVSNNNGQLDNLEELPELDDAWLYEDSNHHA